VSVVRFISQRQPYHRGGLAFDEASKRSPDGRAMVECDQAAMERMGPANFHELLADPNVEVQIAAKSGLPTAIRLGSSPAAARRPAKPRTAKARS
jgi:hypothetical protein